MATKTARRSSNKSSSRGKSTSSSRSARSRATARTKGRTARSTHRSAANRSTARGRSTSANKTRRATSGNGRKSSAELATLRDFYVEELKDLYDAEKKLVKALPKMARAAHTSELRDGFQHHLEQTLIHVERLEHILDGLGEKPGKKCKGMEGLIEEGDEIIKHKAHSAVKDAALICAAQRVEHYEMAGYGCVRTYAQTLGYTDAADLLQRTLDEEGETDKRLTEIAESMVNEQAAGPDQASGRTVGAWR